MPIVLNPSLFIKADIFIEGFSFIILSLFFILAIRSYRLSKNKKTLFLGVGFLLIAFAELSTILTKIVLFYDASFTRQIGNMIITYRILKPADIFYDIGFFLNRFLMLVGFYSIYLLHKRIEKKEVFFLTFLMITTTVLSQIYYFIFHATILILIFLIIDEYFRIYKKNKSKNTYILLNAFIILAAGHILFIVSEFRIVYIFAQLMQLTGYITLLVLIIRILKYDKKIPHGR